MPTIAELPLADDLDTADVVIVAQNTDGVVRKATLTTLGEFVSGSFGSGLGYTPIDKAGDTFTGTPTFAGAANYSGTISFTAGGIRFGTQVGSGSTDLSKHIQLHTSGYGIGITGFRQNYVAPNGAGHYLIINGIDIAAFSSSVANIIPATTIGSATQAYLTITPGATSGNSVRLSSNSTFGIGIGSGSQNALLVTPGVATTNQTVVTATGTGAISLRAPSTGNLTLSSGSAGTQIVFGDPSFGIGSQGTWTFSGTPNPPDGLTGSKLTVHNIFQSQFYRTPNGTYTLGAAVVPPVVNLITNYNGTNTGGLTSASPFTYTISSNNSDTTGFSNGWAMTQITHAFGGTTSRGGRIAQRLSLGANAATPNAQGGEQHVVQEVWADFSYNLGGTGIFPDTSGYIYGMNPQVLLRDGATYITTVNALGEINLQVQPPRRTVTIGGTIGTGDTASLIFTGADITGSPVTVTVTAGAGATAIIISRQLIAAVRNNTALRAADISARAPDGSNPTLQVNWQQWRSSVTVTSGSTGGITVTLGTATTGASAATHNGMTIIPNGSHGDRAHAGSSAINIGSQAVFPTGQFDRGINFGGQWSIQPDGSIISATLLYDSPGRNATEPVLPAYAKYGIDFSVVNFTANSGSSLYMPGFAVKGDGAVEIAGSRMSVDATTGLSIDARGFRGTGNATVSAGGGTVAGTLLARHSPGEVVLDDYGGQHLIATVNNSTGAILTVTTLVQPYSSAGSAPSNPTPVKVAGTSGRFATLNINWQPASSLMLQPSGGALMVAPTGGTVGFFGTTPVAKPTGVAVSAAGVHAALVSLGLIAA